MQVDGKRVAVLVHNQFEDLELWYPVLRLREAGASVTLVGPERGATFKGKNGLSASSDAGIEEVSADDFDAVIVPGGYSPDHMRRVPGMVALVREAGQQDKVVAAICHAGWMLASAGLVRGRRVTSFWSIKDDMTNAGAEWVDEEVVRDGNIVTSRVPSDLPAFCRTVIEVLASV
ncbi:MAG: type 1 glutamine amidotransferase [Gammaproteobacteria bacterium]|nr:type 1 glutamine amidotransferase [Gammaproteobacteria bacterium]NIR83147.1 type 1 glutamine amidotransferase [Gammaproteobacteria bacterium]NIR90955.1 type 1 glutamine amidotransferase [Gammaproteobacteria bacterium]NIU04312.1 type 1 glutamine amidotransferase [Gammaproteobacteria bacterium]NIV52535.1 DJ-1/PfpI/YhbO family deglycase/protease [Gammaproteobacteria bacterium]